MVLLPRNSLTRISATTIAASITSPSHPSSATRCRTPGSDTLPNYARESTRTVRHTQNPLTKTSGVDRMISVIAHEIAELSINLLVNTWYAVQDSSFPVEVRRLGPKLPRQNL
nr:protein EXORDIUM-like 3 [Ipomoea batatas]